MATICFDAHNCCNRHRLGKLLVAFGSNPSQGKNIGQKLDDLEAKVHKIINKLSGKHWCRTDVMFPSCSQYSDIMFSNLHYTCIIIDLEKGSWQSRATTVHNTVIQLCTIQSYSAQAATETTVHTTLQSYSNTTYSCCERYASNLYQWLVFEMTSEGWAWIQQ